MTTIDKATTVEVPAFSDPQGKAFCLSAAFNLPARGGKRLTVAFNAAVTYGDKPSS